RLVRDAEASVRAVDLSEGKRYLTRAYGAESLADWMRQKFGVKMAVEEIEAKEDADLKGFLVAKVKAAYRQKDVEFPVQVAMQNFMSDRAHQGGGQRFDRDGLYRWAAQRLGVVLSAKAGGPDAA